SSSKSPDPAAGNNGGGELRRVRRGLTKRAAGFVGTGEERGRRRRDPVGDVTVQVLADLRRRAVDDQGIDELVGDRGGGGFTVACLPRIPHGLKGFAPTEPGVERGVDRDVEIRGD